jgi:hypothetical protein
MNVEKINSIKDYLFGTPDRVYTFISLLFSFLSIILTVYLWKFPEPVPELIIIRDIVIISLLLFTSGILLFKYIRREQKLIELVKNLESSNIRLSKQFENFHGVVHKFRDNIFMRHKSQIKEDVLVDRERRVTFKKICHSITMDIKEIYVEFLLSKGIDIGDDLSVTIKLTVSQNELISILTPILGSKLDSNLKKRIRKKDKWVYTAYRDPDTFEKPERREVTATCYSIDGNSAFAHIYNEKRAVYACDDLQALGVTYKNENPEWKKYYNATLIAPIRFNDNLLGKCYCFGFIAIDSNNKQKMKLFEYDESRYIIGHSADLLATFFLTLILMKPEIKLEVTSLEATK